MKRYRVLCYSFDTRAHVLNQEIKEDWEEKIKIQWKSNKENITQELKEEFGEYYTERKIQNFCDMGSMPMSILAFHNKFLHQCRTSFIMGAYYPALTGVCALGERILNHLLLALRNDFKHTPQYKEVYNKSSFDNWVRAIDILSAWGILLENVVTLYKELAVIRNKSLHFNPETDTNDRVLTLEAIHLIQNIIGEQFSAFGVQPWFIDTIPGEAYIKKAWESKPFIKAIYLPNCQLVGSKHKLRFGDNTWIVDDNYNYDSIEISDDEFAKMRTSKTME